MNDSESTVLESKDKSKTPQRRFYERNKQAIKLRSAEHYNNNKAAILERNKAYRLAHPEKFRAYDVKWKTANPDWLKKQVAKRSPEQIQKRRDSTARWRKKNLCKVKSDHAAWISRNAQKRKAWDRAHNALPHQKLRRKAYYQKNKKRLNAQSRAWQKSNPDAARAKASKRRAILKGATIGDTRAIVKWDKSWRNKRRVICYYCGASVSPKKCHADHVIPIGGVGENKGRHEVGNLVIACRDCNLKKKDSPLSKWNARLSEPVLL